MKAYKGFDKDLKCHGFQYKVGGEYTEDKALLCNCGFHACENPLDCLSYYQDRFCVVELDDVSDASDRDGDSKRVGEKIKILKEIGVKGLVDEFVNLVTGQAADNVARKYGEPATARSHWGHAAAQGDYGHAAAQGDNGHAAAQGDFGHAEVSGKEAIAAAFGISGQARGALGDWLVLAEWERNIGDWHIKSVKTAKVTGRKIKANVWYKLCDGRFVEVADND